MSDIESVNLWDELGIERRERGADTRYSSGDTAKDGPRPVRKLESFDHAKTILIDVVTQSRPGPVDLKRMMDQRSTNQKGEATIGCRSVVETNEIEIDNLIGNLTESQFACNTVPMLMEKANASCFLGLLAQEQSNGDWVPVDVRVWEDKRLRKNGRRAADLKKLPLQDGIEVMRGGQFDAGWQEAVEVNIRVLCYQIIWMDRNNAPWLPARDWQGRPVTDGVMRVAADPALAEIARGITNVVADLKTSAIDREAREQRATPVDVSARLAEIKAEEAALLAMLDKQTTPSAPPAADKKKS